jgi:Icc-related predicted phosphoesterase
MFINPGPVKEGYAVLLELGNEITAEPLWRDLDH